MKKVLVTGGGGYLGSYVVDALLGDYEVTSFDIKPPKADIAHVIGNVTDMDAVKSAVEGMDAVIHIAAVPTINSGTPEQIIDINVRGSWNMMEASSLAGVKRFVQCSSDSVMGNTVWKEYFYKPDYLPVDEAHPLRPTDPYALSKLMGEEAGRSFAARGKMEVCAMRPVFILFPEMMCEVQARHKDPENYQGPMAGGPVHAGGGLSWHHVDPRDVASAFRRGIEYDYKGFDSFYLAADTTLAPEPTLERIEKTFGGLPEVRDPSWYADNPHAPLYDIRKARDVLGWEPKYNHREETIGGS